MTPVRDPVREKAAGGRDIAGEPGLGVPRGRQSESREGGNRRAGILLIVIGCVLIALAAGEAVAGTSPEPGLDTAARVAPVLDA